MKTTQIKTVDDMFNKVTKHIDSIYFPELKYYRENDNCANVHYICELFNNGCLTYTKLIEKLSKFCNDTNENIEKIVSEYVTFEVITEVIFRKFKTSEIIALFPYVKDSRYFVSSYMHIGQHSGADYQHVIQTTKPATESEYMDLYNKLTKQIGYNLKVIKKASYKKMYK